MIKLSDYVMSFLADRGIEDVFTLTGGGIMHLVDSLGREPRLRYLCNHHEQACAIAAESYARRRNHVGACLVTTGPGSTNALSAIAGAYVDSVPVVVISGQVRRDLFADFTQVRQFGPQEINIDDMARPVTKSMVTLLDPTRVRYELEKAWHLATSGRPGPVWINIPLDVQAMEVDPADLIGFTPDPEPSTPTDLSGLLDLLQKAQRPLWMLGNGIHLCGAEDRMREALDASGFPAVLTIGGLDLLEEAHPLNAGRFGPVGQRRANFCVQNADLILAVGASMSVASIGFNHEAFAPQAKKVLVNIDVTELTKRNLRLEASLAMDAGCFFADILPHLPSATPNQDPRWLDACRDWRRDYPLLAPEHVHTPCGLNSYAFVHTLSRQLPPASTVLTGNALDIVSVLHSFEVKPGQRIYTNINYGAMGWDLPAAVGAIASRPDGPVVLITGDGSLQLNLQELLTLRQYQFPLKIFVLNNQGYESIRSTQRAHFKGHLVGSDPASGVGNPDYRHLAAAYGLDYQRFEPGDDVERDLARFLAIPGPGLAEVILDPSQGRSPRVTSRLLEDGRLVSCPLHDMSPFLPEATLAYEMGRFAPAPDA